jgi:hypothetical protein
MFIVHGGGGGFGYGGGGFVYGGGMPMHPMFAPMFMGAPQVMLVQQMQCKYCLCVMDQQLQGAHKHGCPRARSSAPSVSVSSGWGSNGGSSSSSSSPSANTHTLWHGTSRSNGHSIVRSGFRASTSGQLGAGVYLADETKAAGFATSAASRGLGSGGIVLRVQATCKRLKSVTHSDHAGGWTSEGYDAVHAQKTNASHAPEWCFANAGQVVVTAWRDVNDSCWTTV